MFIKVTRADSGMQLIVRIEEIRAVCTGYENRGSRLLWIDPEREETYVEESVDAIWKMLAARQR